MKPTPQKPQKPQNTQQVNNDLHSKYRPKNFDEMIGHETAVTRLRGQLKTGKLRSAYLFTGPTSVGKTTLARCLAAEINGKPAEQQTGDYRELNAGDQKSIEDMRDLIRVSKFRPSGKKRVFVIDEAQALLTNNAAATAILKPLEEAGKTDTIWIIGSMDAAKFNSGAGKAIANRCDQFALEPPSIESMTEFAKRIVIGEKMSYLKSMAALTKVAEAANQEMRNVANIIQSIGDYYEGLDKKIRPEKLDLDQINKVLASSESNDDRLVVEVVFGALTGQYKSVHRAILDVADPFMFVKKVSWCASFLLGMQVVDKHPTLWWSPTNRELMNRLRTHKLTLGKYAAFNEMAILVARQSSDFTVGGKELMSAAIYRFIKENA
jgi:DNA polymerase III delta prime subunit